MPADVIGLKCLLSLGAPPPSPPRRSSQLLVLCNEPEHTAARPELRKHPRPPQAQPNLASEDAAPIPPVHTHPVQWHEARLLSEQLIGGRTHTAQNHLTLPTAQRSIP